METRPLGRCRLLAAGSVKRRAANRVRENVIVVAYFAMTNEHQDQRLNWGGGNDDCP
jgi:hypothetical protein